MNNQISKPKQEKKSTISLVLGIVSMSLLAISGLMDWFLEPYLEREASSY